MAIMETHVVSGSISINNSPTVIVSGHVQVDNFPTTSVSGNVINISGQPVQTSVSGNVLQASISGDILVTSFSGNVITTVNKSPPIPSTNWVLVNTGFIIPQNTSGGVDLPDIGTFNSGLPLFTVGYSGMTSPNISYGVSGYLWSAPQGVLPVINAFIDSIPFYTFSANTTVTPKNIWPFTNTSQIKVISNVSGATLWYGGFI